MPDIPARAAGAIGYLVGGYDYGSWRSRARADRISVGVSKGTHLAVERQPDGRGFLFAGDVLPDPRDTLPNGSSAVLLALEHRWALPLRDAVLATSGSPLVDAWLGRDALRYVGLLRSDVGVSVWS